MPDNTPLPYLLQTAPYVYTPRLFNLAEPPYIPPTLDIVDDLIPWNTAMITYFLEWLQQRGAIEYIDSGEAGYRIIASRESSVGGAIFDIVNLNMRCLVYSEDLERFIETIRDNDVRHIATDIQSLCITLGTMFPETLINITINKIYRSLDAIPTNEADLTWDEVHRRYPFLWVVIYMQNLLNRFGDLRKLKMS